MQILTSNTLKMKKTTLLLLLILPFLGFSQTWDFTNSNDGWTATQGDLIPGATASTFTYTGEDGNNPQLAQDMAGVDTSTKSYAVITIKNNTNLEYLRVSYPKTDGGRIFKNMVISSGDTEFQTYVIDVTNGNHWVGIMDDIKILFKLDENNNADGSGGTIEIDAISFTATPPLDVQNEYYFETDDETEGWSANNSSVMVSNGILTITPDINASAKIVQETYAIGAEENNYMHIVYRNLSADNDQLRIQFQSPVDDYSSYNGMNMAIPSGMSNFETLDIDLSQDAAWTGETQNFQIVIRDQDNGNSASAGDFEIQEIIFDNNATLATESLSKTSFKMYPNPAKDRITISSEDEISKVEIYNSLGEKVSASTNKTVLLTQLSSGIYFVKVQNSFNKSSVKKLIIE